MKILKYDTENKLPLTWLLTEFSKEIYNREEPISVDTFLHDHQDMIYLIEHDGFCIGCFSYVVTDSSGLSEDILVNDMAYVIPKYRKSRAFALIMKNTLRLVKLLKIKVQIPTENSELVGMAKKFKAKQSYNVFEYSFEECVRQEERLNKIQEK